MRVRLLIFALSLAIGSSLVTWITTSTWRQMDRLKEEFASIQADRFVQDDYVRGEILRLNAELQGYPPQSDPANRDRISMQLQSLGQWLAMARRGLESDDERAAFARIEDAYKLFEDSGVRLLTASGGEAAMLEGETRQILAAAEELSKAQHATFAALLRDSTATLRRLQGLLELSVALLWALAAFLAVTGYRGLILPLTSRLSESRALIQRQEKLASLGVLAAGLAHEIRNPLTAIKFRLFSLNKALPEARDNEDAKVIHEEINRLNRIVKDFLLFARPSDPKLSAMPAERLLQQVVNLLKSPLDKTGIQLQVEADGATFVSVDEQQMQQVLINLIQNSADSIGQHGVITLRIREGTLPRQGGKAPSVILEVSDTGKGIAPEVEKRLFDPFFTTKDGGTGLGLAVAARIVEKHGGVLQYQTKVNQGTTFQIALPKLQNEAS